MPIVLAVVLSGALWFASTGIKHVWPLTWLAPLPLLLVLPDLRAGRAALAAFAGAALGALNFYPAFRVVPPFVVVLLVLYVSVPFVVVALAWRAIARRAPPAVAVVAYPALVVSVEYLVSLISDDGTFGNLAYSQADFTPLVQLASVTGLWGISFVVSLVPAALAVAWRSRHQPRVLRTSLALAALPAGLATAYGFLRLNSPAPAEQVRVGLAACDATVPYFQTEDREKALPVVRAYAARAATLAERGAEFIVLPEKFVGVTPAYAAEAREILAAVAREHRVTIVAGFNHLDPPRSRNLAVVFGPDGGVALEYDKIHFLAGLEVGYRTGGTIGRLGDTPVPTGVAICKDLDFVPLGRAHAQAGVGLLLAPAWDFGADGWLHSRMAILRSVEDGFALARAANEGLLSVSDARGRVVAECPSSTTPDALLNATVPVAPGGTFFSRTGDWFAWICIATSLACGARTWRDRPDGRGATGGTAGTGA